MKALKSPIEHKLEANIAYFCLKTYPPTEKLKALIKPSRVETAQAFRDYFGRFQEPNSDLFSELIQGQDYSYLIECSSNASKGNAP